MLGAPHIDISVYQLELTHAQQSTRVSSAKSSVQKKVVYKRKKDPMSRTKCVDEVALPRWRGRSTQVRQDSPVSAPKLARPESAESRLGGHRCAHTGAGYVITIIIINLSCICR